LEKAEDEVGCREAEANKLPAGLGFCRLVRINGGPVGLVGRWEGRERIWARKESGGRGRTDYDSDKVASSLIW
jgi:hypothetical protein